MTQPSIKACPYCGQQMAYYLNMCNACAKARSATAAPPTQTPPIPQSQMKYCPACGQALATAVTHCGRCGVAQPALNTTVAPNNVQGTCPTCGVPISQFMKMCWKCAKQQVHAKPANSTSNTTMIRIWASLTIAIFLFIFIAYQTAPHYPAKKVIIHKYPDAVFVLALSLHQKDVSGKPSLVYVEDGAIGEQISFPYTLSGQSYTNVHIITGASMGQDVIIPSECTSDETH